jgi:GTP-binding protein HflX
MVLNKIDKLDGTDIRPIFGNNKAVEVSALTGYGIRGLLNAIVEELQPLEEELTVNIPYNDGWVLPYLHRNGNVLYQEYSEDGIKAGVKIKRAYVEKNQEICNFLMSNEINLEEDY